MTTQEFRQAFPDAPESRAWQAAEEAAITRILSRIPATDTRS